jgi:hypothetical protein
MKRLLPVAVAAVVVSSSVVLAAPADSVSVRPAAASGATDFATDVFGDPWDFSNSSDLHLDPGPTKGLTNATIAGGMLQFTAKRGTRGYFSPLWGGYPGSFLMGRDGGLAQNMLDAGTYKVLRMRAFSSGRLSAALFWFTCFQKKSSCEGGMPLSLAPGWNDIVMPIANNPLLLRSGKAWSGKLTDLRVAFNASSTVQVKVDNIYVTPDATTPIVQRPLPVVTSPSAAGCGDYATSVLGHPWLTKRSDFKITSAKLKSFRPGRLVAVNAKTGPKQPKNDPHVTFKLASSGINGNVWHRLTVVESYKGPFNLGSAAGGGTMARVMWKTPAHSQNSQTNDLVTYSGTQTITLDLNTDPRILTDPAGGAGQRYTFKNGKVTLLRWDPNEDRGSRVWTLQSVTLAQDCATTSTFNVTWNDMAFAAGTTAQIQALNPSTGQAVNLTGQIPEAASNNVSVDVTPLKQFGKQSWTIQIVATDASGHSGTGLATGPLVVS